MTPICRAVDYYEGEYPINLNDPSLLLAIFKASGQSADHVRSEDLHAADYMRQAKAQGLKTGLYHYLAPQGIAEQAALFLSVWNKCGGADVCAVDVEVDLIKDYQGRYGNAIWQSGVKTFLDLVSAGTGKTPLIYTNQDKWAFTYTRGTASQLFQMQPPVWTGNYPLWLAWYPFDPKQFTSPPISVIPKGWTLPNVGLWQYEEFGRTKGALANDLNWVSDAFAAQLGAIVPPPVVVPPVASKKVVSGLLTYDDGTIETMIPKA